MKSWSKKDIIKKWKNAMKAKKGKILSYEKQTYNDIEPMSPDKIVFSKESLERAEDLMLSQRIDEIFKLNSNYPIKNMSRTLPPNNFNVYKASGQPQWVNPGVQFSPGNFPTWDDEDKRNVVFYGFNGLLASKYSIVENMSEGELTARMETAKTKVPWVIKPLIEFSHIIETFKQTPNALKEIPFDDAMTQLRMGPQEEIMSDYKEPDEDEFTDACTAECKPGNHSCGK